MLGPSKDHLEHLSEEELDETIDQAQSDDEPYLVRRVSTEQDLIRQLLFSVGRMSSEHVREPRVAVVTVTLAASRHFKKIASHSISTRSDSDENYRKHGREALKHAIKAAL